MAEETKSNHREKKKAPRGTSLDANLRVCACCRANQTPEEMFYSIRVASNGENSKITKSSSSHSVCGSCISCSHCMLSVAENTSLGNAGVEQYYDGECKGCRKRLKAVVSADVAFGHTSTEGSAAAVATQRYFCAVCREQITDSGHIRAEDVDPEFSGNMIEGDTGNGGGGSSGDAGGSDGFGAATTATKSGGARRKRRGLKVIKYYCSGDYNALFGHQCAGKYCGKAIQSGEIVIEALGKKYHAETPAEGREQTAEEELPPRSCFTCVRCAKVLDVAAFRVLGNEPACEACFEATAPKCDHCLNSVQKWVQMKRTILCRRCARVSSQCFSCKTLVLKPRESGPSAGAAGPASPRLVCGQGRGEVMTGPVDVLSDGRKLCQCCSAAAVRTQAEALALLQEVKAVLVAHGLDVFRPGGGGGGNEDDEAGKEGEQDGGGSDAVSVAASERSVRSVGVGDVMDHVHVTLVSREQLKQQLGFCKGMSPLGVTVSSMESRVVVKSEGCGGGGAAAAAAAAATGGGGKSGAVAAVVPPKKQPRRLWGSSKKNKKNKRGAAAETDAAATAEVKVLRPLVVGDGTGKPHPPAAPAAAATAAGGGGGGRGSVRPPPKQNGNSPPPPPPLPPPPPPPAPAPAFEMMETVLSVQAVKVLEGLPRIQLGAVMAHELGHSYMTFKGFKGGAAGEALTGRHTRELDTLVVEGICELFAHLWLKSRVEAAASSSPTTSTPSPVPSPSKSAAAKSKNKSSKLFPSSSRSVFFGNSSRRSKAGNQSASAQSGGAVWGDAAAFLELQKSNEDPVYGGGLRAALGAFDSRDIGQSLPTLLSHVKRQRAFPMR